MCRTSLAGFVVVALTLGVCQPSAAQTDDRAFANLGRSIHSGNTLLVTSRETGEIQGKLMRLSPTSLVIAVRRGQEREIFSTEIGRIERVGDPLWTGALIGAIPVGWFLGSFEKSQDAERPEKHVAKATIVGGALGALIGLAIDASHEARTLVYRAQPTSVTQLSAQVPHDQPPAYPPTAAAPRVPASSLESLWSGDGQSLVVPGDDVRQVTLMRALLGATSCAEPKHGGAAPTVRVMPVFRPSLAR